MPINGCTKFARHMCQAPFNIAYTLCREHHPQYCHFIEDLNEDNDNLTGGVKDNNKQAFAKGNNDEHKSNVDKDDNNNFFDVQEEEVESDTYNESDVEIDDEVADPTYKPGLDMLDFDFENIDDILDSDDESVVNLGGELPQERW